MKHLLIFLTLGLSTLANASAKVNFLNVKEDIVIFTTAEDKGAASPSCVATETAQQWSVSLNSQSGRTLYSLLATSLAGSLNVTVVSAQDCADVTGIERALSITVEPVTTASTTPILPSNSSGGGVYLYKGDGVTKIGPIITIANNYIYYSDPAEPRLMNTHKLQARKYGGYFYAQADCQGPAYLTIANYTAYDLLLGKYYQSSGGSYTPMTIRSMINQSTGTCGNIGTPQYNVYTVDFTYVDPLCGEHACMVKEG